jgi:hypothetical protein
MLSVTATAKGRARSVSTRYGDRLVLDVLGHDGKEYTIWRPGTDSQLPKIANGERVTIAVDSKGKASLLESMADKVTDTVTPTSAPETYNAHNGRSDEIADYVTRLGKLYRHSYKVTRETMANESVSGEDLTAIATTIFIQTVRHFDL